MIEEYHIEQNSKYLKMSMNSAMRAASSAPLGGGIINAEYFLNYKVPYNIGKDKTDCPLPEYTLKECCRNLNIDPDSTVGMMTAADIETLGFARESAGEIWIDSGITVGLGNARRAGEEADYNEFIEDKNPPAGTINIAVITNICFTDSALLEALALVAETKARVIMECGVVSKKSGEIATGTGTDAVAVFSDRNGIESVYCGKHVLAGQMLARAVDSALGMALEKYSVILNSKHWMKN